MSARGPLDPLCEAAVASAAAWTPPTDLAEARRAYEAGSVATSGPLADVEVREDSIAGVPVRRYLPRAPRPGAFVYAAGGGWVFGTPATHDAYTRALAAATSLEVVSVGFRRSPEARLPAAVEDCTAVARAVDATFVGGDSGGGLLAAEVATRVSGLAGCVLLYPALDPALASDDYDAGLPPVRAEMAWYWAQYTGPDRPPFADISPLYRELPATLPPHLILEASHDPMVAEGRAYARELRARGVAVELHTYEGQIHGFARHLGTYPRAADTLRDIAAFVAAR